MIGRGSADEIAGQEIGFSRMITMTELEHWYGDNRVLALPEWHVPAGEQWLVTGPSGSGKTTLLMILSGMLSPYRGKVVLADQDLGALTAGKRDRLRGRWIGIVPQRLYLVGALSVLENLLLAQYLADVSQDADAARGILDDLGIADLAERKPSALSQGQAQRVAIARALINQPRVLLADEPTASLDDQQAKQVAALLQDAAQNRAVTLVIATHDQRLKGLIEHRFDLGQQP